MRARLVLPHNGHSANFKCYLLIAAAGGSIKFRFSQYLWMTRTAEEDEQDSRRCPRTVVQSKEMLMALWERWQPKDGYVLPLNKPHAPFHGVDDPLEEPRL